MTPEELATHFERIRSSQRQIQLAVYRTRMAAPYHVGKARDMVADNDRARALTGIDDVAQLGAQLPALIERITQLNDPGGCGVGSPTAECRNALWLRLSVSRSV